MSQQSRTISLSFGTLLIVGLLGSVQFEIMERLDRLADTADMQMCLEAVRVGIDPQSLPQPCRTLRAPTPGGEST